MIKILIIDDQVSIIKGLEEILIKNGFLVSSALSAEEAYSIIYSEKFDFIISDLKLPGQTGIELAFELQKKNYPAKIFLISAYFTLEDALSAFKANISDMFPKPFNSKDIIKRINELYSENKVNVIKNESSYSNTNFKFIKGINEFLHSGNYYSNGELCWKYFFYNSINDKIKTLVAYGVKDEEWGALVNTLELWKDNKFDFMTLKEHAENSLILKDIMNENKAVFFIEIDKINKTLSFIQFGIYPMLLFGIDNDKITFQELNSKNISTCILPDKWLFVFSLNYSKSKNATNKSKENNIFNNDIWFEISENKIYDLFKLFSIQNFNTPFICFYPFLNNDFFERKINLDIIPEKQSFKELESFLVFALELLGATSNQKYKITFFIAEMISFIMKKKYEKGIKFSIVFLKNKNIKLTSDNHFLIKEYFNIIENSNKHNEKQNLLAKCSDFHEQEIKRIVFDNESKFTYEVGFDDN